MPRHEERIRRILGEEEEAPRDHSLRSHAIRRAMDAETPRTLTPWEWQEWYEQHGKPNTMNPEPRRRRWWQRLLRR